MRELVLHRNHQTLGAVFGVAGKWEVPVRYGDPRGEYQAVRTGAGLADLSYRGKLWMRGRDRQEFLHRMVTNEVKDLRPGEGTYAALLNTKGKMLATFQAYVLEEALLLDVEPENTAACAEELDKYVLIDDVTIEDYTDRWGLLGLYGPRARQALEATAGEGPLPEREGFHTGREVAGARTLIAHHRSTGWPGFHLYCEAGQLPSLWDALWEAGQEVGVRTVGLEALEALRVEAGIPRYGVDMDESTIPIEAGLEERAISYTKGCYVGQEVIARIKYQGHVTRLLVGLLLPDGPLPARGTELFQDARKAGWVTSAVFSPGLARNIGLGYSRRETAEPGTHLRVGEENGPEIEVTALPFRRPA